MTCPVRVVEQLSSYALCSPNLWMIIGCTFMTLLTMMLMFYLHFGFRRDLKFLRFCDWKLQQLAERLRFQEPNVTLLERITRKVNEKNYDDVPNFKDFFSRKEPKVQKAGAETDVAAKVKKAKDEDAAKILKDTDLPCTTPAQKKAKEAAEGNQSMLKKWTKDILAIDDDVDSNNNGLDVTQDVPDLKL